MEIRRRTAVSRDGQLHQPHFEAHPQSDRHSGHSERSRAAGFADGRRLALIAVLLAASPLFASSVFALTARLVDSTGRAVAGAQISVVQQSGSARTDADGRFTI